MKKLFFIMSAILIVTCTVFSIKQQDAQLSPEDVANFRAIELSNNQKSIANNTQDITLNGDPIHPPKR